jgi:hypothetical protein
LGEVDDDPIRSGDDDPIRSGDDDPIRSVVTRLGRKHPSGGMVIERAAILAEGADFEAVMAWIVAHGGRPEATVKKAPASGLHGSRGQSEDAGRARPPSRFVLPADALS